MFLTGCEYGFYISLTEKKTDLFVGKVFGVFSGTLVLNFLNELV